MKILIVDPQISTRTLTSQMLDVLGHRDIERAKDGKDALSLMNQQSFDLAFVDLDLPDISGIEVIKQAGQLALQQRIYSFICVDKANHSKVNEAIANGADDFVLKPITAEVISRKLEKLNQNRN